MVLQYTQQAQQYPQHEAVVPIAAAILTKSHLVPDPELTGAGELSRCSCAQTLKWDGAPVPLVVTLAREHGKDSFQGPRGGAGRRVGEGVLERKSGDNDTRLHMISALWGIILSHPKEGGLAWRQHALPTAAVPHPQHTLRPSFVA